MLFIKMSKMQPKNDKGSKRMRPSLKKATENAAKALWDMVPVILATILLISLINTLIPKTFYTRIFSGNLFFDSLIGSIVGSISAGNPIISYIFGGELLVQGISLIAVTAFLVAWVTVGVVQLPAESTILGKRFAITRNILSFIFSIITALLTVIIITLLGGI